MSKKTPVKDTSLSPAERKAERTAKFLAFKRGHGHNFTYSTAQTAPSKKIPVAGSRFATV